MYILQCRQADQHLPPEVRQIQNWEPDAEASLRHIEASGAVSAEQRRAQIISQISCDQRARDALDAIINGATPVRAAGIEAATTRVNATNAAIHAANRARLHEGLQAHNGSYSSGLSVSGTFPTTTTLNPAAANHAWTLRHPTNAAVIVLQELLGGGVPLHEAALLSNMTPTTVPGDYTKCPKDADFALFAQPYADFLREQYAHGVRSFVCVGTRNEAAVLDALCPRGHTAVCLAEHNNSRLLLVLGVGENGSDGRQFLLLVPHEHMSHVMWQALSRSSRLWLLAGLVHCVSALQALRGKARPDAKGLLELVGPEKAEGKRSGWFSSGAYAESVMRGARRLQFIRAFGGEEEGLAKWQAWYTDCKRRAGALFVLALLR